MNESDDMLTATSKALALLAHAIGATGDARVMLANLMANYSAQVRPGAPTAAFDQLATAMLLSLSSLALKQHPDDPQTRRLYQELRPAKRH